MKTVQIGVFQSSYSVLFGYTSKVRHVFSTSTFTGWKSALTRTLICHYLLLSDTYLLLTDIEKIAEKVIGIRTVLTNNGTELTDHRKKE